MEMTVNVKDCREFVEDSKFSQFLLNNTTDFCVGNILLIGSTGYLGAHILDAFMKNNKGTIYCLVRPRNSINIEKRLNILTDATQMAPIPQPGSGGTW